MSFVSNAELSQDPEEAKRRRLTENTDSEQLGKAEEALLGGVTLGKFDRVVVVGRDNYKGVGRITHKLGMNTTFSQASALTGAMSQSPMRNHRTFMRCMTAVSGWRSSGRQQCLILRLGLGQGNG